MYSIVLMAAMSGAPDATGFNGFFRDLFHGSGCNGCNGCSGGARYSCSGGCSGTANQYASCTGCSGCSGCCGGGVFSGFGTRVRQMFQPKGCCGCCGSYTYGCVGSAYSCFGSSPYSCFGGPVMAYNPTINGGLTCQGGPVPFAPPPNFDAMPSYPSGIPYAPPEVAPPTGGTVGVRPAGGFNGTTVSSGPNVQQIGRATVVIRLPADARLYADDAPLLLTGTERKFTTPDLPTGMEYTYRFRAEYERDGEVVGVTKKVAVRAGGSVTIEFTDLTAAKVPASGSGTATGNANPVTASPVSNTTPAIPSVLPTGKNPAANTAGTSAPTDRAMISVTLPPGATLYVDDRKSPSTSPVRQFATPPLPAGREFAYLMKAEVVRNGQPEYLIQKITFRAGERVTVDFTSLGK